MPFKLRGNAGVDVEVDPLRRLLVTVRPPDWGALGSYRKAMPSGTMAAALAGASPVYSFRYGSANLAIVKRVFVAAGDLVAFTAGLFTLNMFVARSFNVSDSGGTAAILSGHNGKLRTSMAPTGVTDIRISATATLTAGTRTKDTDPIGSLGLSVPAVAGQIIIPGIDIYRAMPGDYPLVLAQNEGFVIEATVPATGTWQFSVATEWDELTSF